MAGFQEHIHQTKRNLTFLSAINLQIPDCIDWQVTVCFYAALHLVNAHLSQYGQQYRKHHDVNFALNPYAPLSVSKLPEAEYDAYVSLQRLSRRSRYLVNEKEISAAQAHFTTERHLSKAVRHLDVLLCYFSNRYTISFSPIQISESTMPRSYIPRYFFSK